MRIATRVIPGLRCHIVVLVLAMSATFGLNVHAANTVVRSTQSGPWSATETWEQGQVPTAGDRVLIQSGHQVKYDVQSDHVIRGIVVAGSLIFATDRDTRLNVGMIRIEATDEYSETGFDCEAHLAPPAATRAELVIGTARNPVDRAKTARIRLVYLDGMDKGSLPAIVCCGGRMDIHGAPIDETWVKLDGNLRQGDTKAFLAKQVADWKVGDHVVLTATSTHGTAKDASSTEEFAVSAVDGSAVTLDRAVEFPHAGTGDFRGELANLSRNVIVESADPQGVRGHTMYHRDSAGSLSYAEFRHLGKPGVLGRYSLHYHLVGDTMRGSSVIGNSIWDSGNRWLTIHGTNYLVVRDNVGYRSLGHGYFLEDGTEVFNVLDHNLAVGAKRTAALSKQVLPFDANEGAGFWWANSLNSFTDNVAANCDQYGFRFEATQSSALKLTLPVQSHDGVLRDVDIRTLPFVRFDGNEVHSSEGLYGINLGEGVDRVGPDAKHPFVVRNTRIWDVHYGFRPQVPSLLVENMSIHHFVYGVYHPNFDHHVYRNMTLSDAQAAEPFNRGHDDLSIQYGMLTVDGLTFDNVRSGGMPLIQISDDNASGSAVSHFRNVRLLNWTDGSRERALVNLGGGPRPVPKSSQGVSIYLHDWFGPGETAEIVSIRSPEFKANPKKYASVTDLTGDESRAAQVTGIAFPELLQPVDDLPPTSVITHIRDDGATWTVSGIASDNNQVKRVIVNGVRATSRKGDFTAWEVTIPKTKNQFRCHAEDLAGNIESRPHVISTANATH